MVRCTVIIVLVLVTVGCVKLEEDCVSKGNCNRTENQTDTENDSLTPYIQEITAKPIEKPKALNMYIEDQVATGVHPAEITAVPAAEAKGRALDFNVDDHSNGLTNSSGIKDLSDVSMDDDELEEPIKNAKILAPKSIEKNSTLGICEKGGLTYENGEKLEVGCDSICTCSHGKMDCVDRCTGPFIRKGKKIDDPFCSEKAADDHCCSVLQCTSDTETEPLELCTYMNKTYHRGDVIQEGCMEVCSCEAGGHLACKPRCNAIKKTSDKCLEIPDMNDPCCKTVICDVTLKDNKLISARYTNTTTIKLEFEGKIEMNQTLPLIDISDDKNNWKTFTPLPGGYLSGLSDPNYKFAKIENTDDIIEIQSFDETKKPTKDKLKGTKFCDFKGMEYKLGEEFSDACEQFCVCKETGVKCIKMECPTYFGTDVLDPNCIEWDTVPSNFTPTPPLCCPEKLRCKNNGSCEYEGETYQNWNQIPTNITGCKKRCYCEMGKVECQNICPPVTAHPPANIECPAHQAVLGPLPGDDCCVYWTCPEKDDINSTEPIKTEEIISQNKTDSPFVLPFVPTKSPSKTLGPLLVYANGDNKTVENDLNLHTNSQSTKKPTVLLQENPYFEKNKKTNNDVPYLGPFNPAFKPPQKPKDKNNKPNKTTFVTAPTISNDNYIPENNYADLPNKVPNDHIHIHGKGDPHEFLHLLNQHPEIANYPPGSVLEIHNIPQRPEYNPNAIDPNILNPNVIQANAENVNGLPPNIINQNILNRNAINPNNLHPNRLNPNSNKHIPLPAGISLEQILQEIHKGGQSNAVVPYSQYPTNDGQIFLPPPPNRPLFNGRPQQNTSGLTHPGIFSNGFSNIPGYPQPQDDINVHILEALDAHTIRLAFTVPPVIVGLHGRVEVRYTNKDDEDQNTWELQVFAPPNDLIATPQLEFDLVDLRAETEYKIKITVTLRDLHNTPTSRVYTIKTLKEIQTSALPPSIPIDPELIITNINATWVNVAWRKFTEYELQFIDGVQLRYKEIDGKIYAATPLIHRAVTSYTLENLKPNNKYEIGIFFIPFPGQQTELHAEHMLHFTTANEVDTYGFNVSLEISLIKPTNVEISWSGVPYPEDKYVNIYRAIYQSDSGKGDSSTFKIAKRDLPPKTTITDLKPGTRYRLWLEVYLTNGKIKTSNVQDFITKPRPAPTLGASSKQDKLSGEFPEERSDYYGPLVIVAILAAIAILSTLVLLLILVKRQNQNKACITPPPRVSQSAYDNPTYKVEIQQETMDL